MSLGVNQAHFKELFEENDSIMRLNYYPRCQKPDLTLGTGPHCDPTSLTILHQDSVGGLEVFVDNEWHSIAPNLNAFFINIGDTFMVGYLFDPYIIICFLSLFWIFSIVNVFVIFRHFQMEDIEAAYIELWLITKFIGNHLLFFSVQRRIRW